MFNKISAYLRGSTDHQDFIIIGSDPNTSPFGGCLSFVSGKRIPLFISLSGIAHLLLPRSTPATRPRCRIWLLHCFSFGLIPNWISQEKGLTHQLTFQPIKRKMPLTFLQKQSPSTVIKKKALACPMENGSRPNVLWASPTTREDSPAIQIFLNVADANLIKV